MSDDDDDDEMKDVYRQVTGREWTEVESPPPPSSLFPPDGTVGVAPVASRPEPNQGWPIFGRRP